MIKIASRYSRCLRAHGRVLLFFPLFLIAVIAANLPGEGEAFAVEVEVVTPSTGKTIVARNPETHLVLRQAWSSAPRQVRVENTGEILEPTVVMDDGEYDYFHFRLPLKPGQNSFIVLPGSLHIDLDYRRLQADLSPNSLGKDVYLFHQDEILPESCGTCHDLHMTSTIDPVGLKKQDSCAGCHGNIFEKGLSRHGPAASNQCLTCHQKFLKPWRIGFSTARRQDICLACHTEKRNWFTKKFIHGPLNIGGCTLCHDPHGGKYPYQLWAEETTEICISCHGDKENLVLTQNRLPFVHGIIRGKGCVGCHDPHATDQQFMLYKPINELCVSCHTGLLGVTRGHPVGGHPVEGPRERRRPGRQLTCVSCHDPHGSRYQALLIGDRRGGNVCVACHR